MVRELGPIQKAVLAALMAHGVWHKNCGWVYENNSRTAGVLEALAKAGMVIGEPWGNQGKIYVPVESPVRYALSASTAKGPSEI